MISGLEGPVGMVAGPDDTVYVTEAFAGQVSKVGSKGEKTVVAKDLKGPEGIALSPDGKLIVAEVGAKRIESRSIRRTEPSPRSPATCRSAFPPHPADCRATSRPASASAQPG